jgi:hypothetical protein
MIDKGALFLYIGRLLFRALDQASGVEFLMHASSHAQGPWTAEDDSQRERGFPG